MKNALYLLPLLLLANSLLSQNKTFLDQAYIETISSVDTMVIPDRIYFNIKVSEQDIKGKETFAEFESKMLSSLKEVGINLEKQLSLSNLSGNYKDFIFKKDAVITFKNYELLVYDAIEAGKVLFAMKELGVSNININKTEYSRKDQLLLRLKSQAILKAKDQALSMTVPLNQKLGKAIFISDSATEAISGMTSRLAGYNYDYIVTKEKSKLIPLDFQKIKYESKVNVKFILN